MGLNVFKVSVAGTAVGSGVSVGVEAAVFDFALARSLAEGRLG